MNSKLIGFGLALWAVGTAGLRLAGQHVLHAGDPAGRTVLLFAASAVLMAWMVRRVCGRLAVKDRIGGAVSIALPTLLLDPFSSAFFTAVFPNMAPETAGIFGGWMLICCAGALVGALLSETAA